MSRNLCRIVLLALCLTCFVLSCSNKKPLPVVQKPLALVEHNKRFTKRIEKVGDNVYSAIGYGLANSIMVVTDNGKVIVDTTESAAGARQIRQEFDKIAPGPVQAIIYTHTHPDHTLGASVFQDENTAVWATDQAIGSMNEQFASLSTILRIRGHKQFGEGLDPKLRISDGLGPFLRLDDGPVPPVVYPTQTFRGRHTMEIGGVIFELHQAPGETRDQLFVWLPKQKILLPGDNIYAAFPNLYSTRGVPPRPVRSWMTSLGAMRDLEPDHLVPSHTEPVSGKEKINALLIDYRDAIAYVHDSVIRMANQGKSPDDMARDIRLPDRLRDHPYLQEFYGKVSWSARGIYDGYLGWFDGNPTSLLRLHPEDRATRLLPLLGGASAALDHAKQAVDKGDYQWAAELCDWVLATDPKHAKARSIKADALWQMGLAQENPNARNYLLSCALELRGKYKAPQKPQINSETIRDVPIEAIIRSFPERLNPAKSADATMTIVFSFTDTKAVYSFFIRQGIGEVKSGAVKNPDLKIAGTVSDFKALLIGELPAVKALAQKRIVAEGGIANLIRFQKYLLKP